MNSVRVSEHKNWIQTAHAKAGKELESFKNPLLSPWPLGDGSERHFEPIDHGREQSVYGGAINCFTHFFIECNVYSEVLCFVFVKKFNFLKEKEKWKFLKKKIYMPNWLENPIGMDHMDFFLILRLFV